MNAHHVELRLLRWGDWSFCRQVAADPAVREASFDGRAPTAFRHLRWFLRHWYGGARRGFVLLRQGMPAGVVTWRVDRGTVVWVGIALRPCERGRGLGPAALRLARIMITNTLYPGAQVRACIKATNTASRAAFTRAGFRLDRIPCRHPHGGMEYAWP